MRALKRKQQKIQNTKADVCTRANFLWTQIDHIQKTGSILKAEKQLEELLELIPHHFPALHYLGGARYLQGRNQEAYNLTIESLKYAPDYYLAALSLSEICLAGNLYSEAIQTLEYIIGQHPDMPGLYYALGNVYWTKGDLKKARENFLLTKDRCTDASPVLDNAKFSYDFMRLESPRIFATPEEDKADEKAFFEVLEELTQKSDWSDLKYPPLEPVKVFYTAYSHQHPRKILEALGNFLRAKFPLLAYTSPLVAEPKNSPKIKIGIVSDKINITHPVHWCFAHFIENLDRNKFELIHFTNISQPKKIADEHLIHGLKTVLLPGTLETKRQAIEEENLDVLWYLDVGITSMAYPLAYSRLAPVQCVSLGHPCTTGLPSIDYMISSDEIEPENAQEFYTEKLIPLKGLPVYYKKSYMNPAEADRDYFKLPNDKNIYLCSQTPFKIQYDMDDIFYNILKNDPEGVIVVIEMLIDKQFFERMKINKLKEFEDRILVVPAQPFPHYLALLKNADVFLDTIPFGGSNSSFQSIAMGTPIALMDSEQAKGRITAALYRRMGLEQYIAKTPEEYVKNAVALGRSPALRAELREHFEKHQHKIFECPMVVHEHNRLFEKLGQESRMKNAL